MTYLVDELVNESIHTYTIYVIVADISCPNM